MAMEVTSSSSSQIPIEIVSDEEMSLIEAAFSLALAGRSISTSTSTPLHFHPKRSFSDISISVGDIEDGAGIGIRKKRVNESLLHRFRRRTGLFVTDITSTEWCEKQKEFFLLCGSPKATKAMKAGTARHAILEEEVITRVEVQIRSAEEHWAIKMINFIHGTNQLLLEGLTRELPLIGFVEGVCIVGIIDEIRMTTSVPMLVETKTRARNTLPSEPQLRNGRLQLMCYKYLWDGLVANPFPCGQFLELFSLNPNSVLSKEVQDSAIQAGAGVAAQTLNEVLMQFQYFWSMLPQSHHQLLLRYEYQKDESLIGEDEYLYDYDWVKGEIRYSIEFWKGEREASLRC